MQQTSVIEFLKELAVGYKTAKSYPTGHPVMEKVVASTIGFLSKLYAEYPEFSFYFLEKTVIFQDTRIDVSKNLAVLSFIEALRKNEIESLTFNTGATSDDVKNLYEVMSSPKVKIKEYGDAATMMKSKGTEKIKINAVKFGIQTGATVQVAREKQESTKPTESLELVEAINNFSKLIAQGVSMIDTKAEFEKIVNGSDKIPIEAQSSHSDTIAKILENLPSEHRIELLRDVGLKPFVLKILSNLSEEKLVELIVTKAQDPGAIKKVLGALNEDKFSKLLPMLKEKIPDVYEYLAQLGILLSERVTAFFSKEDLYSSIRPYFNMLDSQNARVREEGIKSLCTLADRFIRQGNIEIAEEIGLRLASAFEQEAVPEVFINSLEQIYNIYNVARQSNQIKICNTIIEPFNRILGRSGISVQFKKSLINFLGETENPRVLSTLLSFLWESGLYPEVRAAIIKLGKSAVSELLLTLKDAEDYSLRMKIVDILKNIGKSSLDILLKNIDAPEWYLRRNILAIIGEIGAAEVCPQIESLINDPDDRVRLELVRTFIRLNYPKGLKALLNDTALEVRAEALRGLRKYLSTEEVIALLPALKEKGDFFNAELLKIIGEKKLKDTSPNIVEYLKILELRDDETAQGLKELAISTLIRLSPSDLKAIFTEFTNSKDKFLANLCQSALKKLA
ncbi:MAG: HEAT repeat domain-containing protein [bacterium]